MMQVRLNKKVSIAIEISEWMPQKGLIIFVSSLHISGACWGTTQFSISSIPVCIHVWGDRLA